MVLPFFAITLFVSAFCLFLVQPIIGKLILPKLGGTPQVWNTCMVFFQTALLAGYGYTHSVSTRLNLRQQLMTHACLLFLPLLVLLPVPYTSFPGSTGPFSFPEWTPPLGGNPIPQTLLLLSWIVGIPFLVVATSAPLLQKWFSTTGHPAAKDPYFLYGASNLGSLLALLLYPVAVEPWFNLSSQSWLFFGGYCLLMVLVLGCVGMVWQTSAKFVPSPVEPPHPTPTTAAGTETAGANPAPVSTAPASTATSATPPPPAPTAPAQPATPAPAKTSPAGPSPSAKSTPAGPSAKTAPAGPATGIKKGPPKPGARQPLVKPSAPGELSVKADQMTVGRRIRWIALAAVPSSFMLGVTSHITTDLSPMPLFWLVPLSLYLLSFILVFSKWPVVWVEQPHRIVLFAQPVLIAFMLFCEVWMGSDTGSGGLWTIVSFNILAFFATALMCHGEMAKDRPSTQHLTEYFLLMSVGGMLGGMFNGLVAPIFFYGLAEFPIAVILACLVRPMLFEDGWVDNWLSNMLEPPARAVKPVKGGQAGPVEKATSYTPLLDFALPALVFALGFAITFIIVPNPQSRSLTRAQISMARGIGFFIPLAIACFYLGRQYRLTLAIAGIMLLQILFEYRMEYGRDAKTLVSDRSYFGIIRVKQSRQRVDTDEKNEKKEGEYSYTQLVHGHILHGQNFMIPEDPKDRGNPYRDFSRIATTYYHRRGPAGVVMEKFNWFHQFTPGKTDYADYNKYQSDARICASLVGVNALIPGAFPMDAIVDGWSEPPFATIGLGTGTMASYGRPFQYVHYYEIDDHIRRLSLPGKKDKRFRDVEGFPDGVPYFNYLKMAELRGCNVEVLMGDARLRMAFPYDLVLLTTNQGKTYRGVIKSEHPNHLNIDEVLKRDTVQLVDTLKTEHNIPSSDVRSLKRDYFAGGVELVTKQGKSYRGVLKGDYNRTVPIHDAMSKDTVIIVDSLRRETSVTTANIQSLKRDKSYAGGPENFYHMMVVDAFSSDAIPAHLITRQAIELYFTKLIQASDEERKAAVAAARSQKMDPPEYGVLCVHTSNRFVNLPLVVAAVSQNLGLAYRKGHDGGADTPEDRIKQQKGIDRDYSVKNVGRSSSEWVMVGRISDDLSSLAPPPGYVESDNERDRYWDNKPDPDPRFLWTDDHYNLLNILRIWER